MQSYLSGNAYLGNNVFNRPLRLGNSTQKVHPVAIVGFSYSDSARSLLTALYNHENSFMQIYPTKLFYNSVTGNKNIIYLYRFFGNRLNRNNLRMLKIRNLMPRSGSS